MPRAARIVIPGCPHHIVQRGNNRQAVFFDAEDRRAYLSILKKISAKHGLQILGYCLMDNHVHLVAMPAEEDSLAKAVGVTNFTYAQEMNILRGRDGHFWQGRYFSCPLDESHLWTALRYVEQNPVRAGLVRSAWEYEWSSARAHVQGFDERGLVDLTDWNQNVGGFDWRKRLQCAGDMDILHKLRESTQTGMPFGSEMFIDGLEKSVGRRLRPRKPGRPKEKR
jgi:putative transposase